MEFTSRRSQASSREKGEPRRRGVRGRGIAAREAFGFGKCKRLIPQVVAGNVAIELGGARRLGALKLKAKLGDRE